MRYPGAEWRPIAVNFQRGGNSPKFLIEHIMQGTLAGTDSWFRNPASEVSAHFGIGKSGEVIQWVDTADVAWHAMAANHESIGVEHEGDTGQQLTPAQLEADSRLLAWAHKHHPIPLRLAHHPVLGAGLAYHALGGEAWGGHLQCPGAPIVAQLPLILKNARHPHEPKPPAPATLLEDPMLLNRGAGAITPVALPSSCTKVRFFTAVGVASIEWQLVGEVAHPLAVSWASGSQVVDIAAGKNGIRVTRVDAGVNDVSVALES